MKKQEIKQLYNELKRQIEDEYQEAILQAETKRKNRLAAIETMSQMTHQSTKRHTSSGDQNDQKPSNGSVTYGSLANSVVKAIELVPSTFTKKDIKRALKEVDGASSTCKDTSITGCLVRLARSGKIEQVSTGQGRRPNTYHRITAKTQDLSQDSTIENITVQEL
jgi:hypothetical protein